MKTIILEVESEAEEEISRVVQGWMRNHKVRVKNTDTNTTGSPTLFEKYWGKLSKEGGDALEESIRKSREEWE